MESSWLIVVCAVVTHALLTLVALPSYWRPLQRNGWTAADLLVPVVVPLAFASILLSQLLTHWNGLSSPILVVGGLGVGAATATVIIALSRLRRLGT